MRLNSTICLLTVCISLTAFGQLKQKSVIHPAKTNPVQPIIEPPKLQKGSVVLQWDKPVTETEPENQTATFLFFKGAKYDVLTGFLPKYAATFVLEPGATQAKVTLVNPVYQPLTPSEIPIARAADKYIPAEINLDKSAVIATKKSRIYVSFIPIRKTAAGQYEKLVSFSLDVKQIHGATARLARHNRASFATTSVLATGKWYKIGIAKDGIYKLDYTFFKNMGFNMSSHPANIRIYGNGGHMLPDSNKSPRLDDLVENAIYVNGQTDSSFGANDYVLFYGQGPYKWTYDNADNRYHHQVNLYSDTSYYFITADLGPGKRIQSEAVGGIPTDTVNTFDDYDYHEQDLENLIQSGNMWFGESFDAVTSYNIAFNFPNIVTNVPGFVQVALAARNCSTPGIYQIGSVATISTPTVDCALWYATYAAMGIGTYTFTPTGSAVNVNITKLTSSSVGWLYYVETNVRRNLTMTNGSMAFRDMKSVGPGKVSLFSITSGLAIQLWDVSNPQNVMSVPLTASAGTYKFILHTDTLKQFLAYDNSVYGKPTFFGVVPNQNLHGMPQADLVIVSNPGFLTQAQQLAAFHHSHDNLNVNVVTTTQVYNEFSSGRQDPVAIRDFMRMFYNRSTSYANAPKYLLLFGDASYDPKNRTVNNSNYIVTYESNESFTPTASFVSDDYFAVLDSTEGPITGSNPYTLTISVGRIPCDNAADANSVLNKIISYETQSGEPAMLSTNCCTQQLQYNMGNWRNEVCFIAHDGDGGEHERNADALAKYVNVHYPNLNVNKIYCDAFPLVQTPGGARYPAVNTAINNQINQGALIMNFTGHGGVLGLAFQRILTFSDIYSWNNNSKLSLFFTASCEFARFDNPQQVSAGELCLLVPNGGNIGLMTTTRDVYSAPNQDMNQAFFDSLYSKLPDGSLPRTGDLFSRAKDAAIAGGSYVNSLMFSYLGDPAVRLNYPTNRVFTSTINSVPVSATADTLKALSKVTVTGYVGDTGGNVLSGYNGILYPTIYDKPDSITTLDNPNGSNPPNIYFPFALQNSILYRGRISVTNGRFSFSFVIPKDINYRYGFGKLSYYAQDGSTDATGNYQNVIIGGSNPLAHNNGKGPQVRLYMNDSNFVFGGTTNENPQLLGIVFDSNGINTTGNSVGHDISAVIDNNTQNTFDLTNYFQPALNSYQKGTVTYPFSNLSPGKHSLTLRVWNVYNNSSQAYTEFNVEPKANLQLNHVLNYPNPFTTKTQFYFETNEVCDVMDVQIQIFTISGKLVRNILTSVKSDSFRSQPIDWDGRDDYGDKIGNGVYIYHLKIRTSGGTTADTYQKLVIL